MRADHGLNKKGSVRFKFYIILLCFALLAGCVVPSPVLQASPDATVNTTSSTSLPGPVLNPPTTAPPVSPIPQPIDSTSPPQFTPVVDGESSPPAPIDIPAQYKLDATLDFYQHTLSVIETISYVNVSTDELEDLILVVEPNRLPGGFSLVSLTWASGETIEIVDLNKDQMHITLPHPLVSGDKLSLIVSYTLEIPEITPPSEIFRPQPYGYTERQTNIVDWYPYIPPYRSGEGWLVHEHWWFGEHQVYDLAGFQVRLTLAEPVQDLVVAASAPATQVGNTYTYSLEPARTFALSVSNAYLVQSITAGDVTIYSYFFSFDKNAGQEVLRTTAEALQLYDQLFMPYPHASLSVVEADFLDGMEYDGIYFLSHGFYDLYDGTPKGYLTFIAAHETAHQWWYGMVGNDQALEPWLDEALCTYMEHIFYENIYADYPPGSGQSLVDWWWYYRVNYYEPVGWVDGTIYDFSQFRPYRDAIYLNGANFLDDLRNLIGDQAFFAFLKDYAQRNKYHIATATDFFTLLRQHTSKDLDELQAEYFQVAR